MREHGLPNKNILIIFGTTVLIFCSFYNISRLTRCNEIVEYQQEKLIFEEKCVAVQSVVFVKTHKTASSTMQNIFLRYGLKHDVRIAMPKNNGNRFNWPRPFAKRMIKPFDDSSDKNSSITEPVIIANHLRASQELYDTFPGAKTITIIRDIPSLYESSFGYMRTTSAPYKKAGTIEKFYENPMKFYNETNPAGPEGADVFARNHVAFDLGLPWTKMEKIEESIEYLDATFDLVLLADYFKESVILLRKELCWDWEDVLFFVTNQRSERTTISSDLAQKMRDWNYFDTAIYSHFNKTFWEKIEAYKNFDEDMKILEEKLEQIKLICLAGEKICDENDRKCQFNPGSGIKLKAYELSETGKNKTICNYMTMPELTLSKEIFQKQWPGWKKFYEQ